MTQPPISIDPQSAPDPQAPVLPQVPPVATMTPPPTPDPTASPDPFAGAVLQDLATPVSPGFSTPGRGKEIAPPTAELNIQTQSETTTTPETPVTTAEMLGSMVAEAEPAKELGPEIEKTIERIEQHKVSSTTETAVQADQAPAQTRATVSQPVVVLPLSEQGMDQGKNKNTTFSVRWLYEWSKRQIKKFADTLVVYRE